MRALTSPPIPPLWRVGQTTAVKIKKLSVLLAQLVTVLSSVFKGHGFDSPRVLFHFPMYLSVCIWLKVRIGGEVYNVTLLP